MKKLVTVLLLITIFSCALVLVGCTVNKDKNGDQIGQSNTLTTDPIVGKYKQPYPVSSVYPIKDAYFIVNKDGTAIRYIVFVEDELITLSSSKFNKYWTYHKEDETYEFYELNPISGEKVNVSYYTLAEVKEGKLGTHYTRITDDEWPDCIPEE
ncbi:MAG: hypothetical protein ACI4MV_01345 [Christensenellales bacterium]